MGLNYGDGNNRVGLKIGFGEKWVEVILKIIDGRCE